MNKRSNNILLFGVILVSLILIFSVSALILAIVQQEPDPKWVDVSEFQADLEYGVVREATIRGSKYLYIRNTAAGEEKVQIHGVESEFNFIQQLKARQMTPRYEEEDDGLLKNFGQIVVDIL